MAGLICADTHHPHINRMAAGEVDQIVTLIAVAAFAADRVVNNVVVSAAVVLNLNLDVDAMTNNIAIVFKNLQRWNGQRDTQTVNVCIRNAASNR